MKTCSACKTTLPRSEFHKSTKAPDGLLTHCKQCARAKRLARENETKDCDTCGQEYYGLRSRTTCRSCTSGRNAQEANRRNRACPPRRVPTTGLHLVRVIRFRRHVCEWCGCSFIAEGNRARRYCETSCKNKARAARKAQARGEFAVSRSLRLKIYERDNYICHLCGQATLKSWSTENMDNSPTLDHVIPRSLNGSDDETNLRVAHHRCNYLRGNKLLVSECV